LHNVPDHVTLNCEEEYIYVSPTAEDTCGAVTLVHDEETAGSCDHSHSIIHTWTATDEAGNSISATQTVMWVDVTAPVLSFSGAEFEVDITAECDDLPQPPVVTATDNCAGDVSVLPHTARINGTHENAYRVIRSWSARDDCGNGIMAVQTITVIDTTPPVLDPPSPIVDIDCEDLYDPVTPDVDDNCDEEDALTITHSSTKLPGTCDQAFEVIHTWVATDMSGNQDTVSSTVRVTDVTPPILSSVAEDDYSLCDHEHPPSASAFDRCDPYKFIVGGVPTTLTNVSVHEYSIQYTFTATDDCGNSAVDYTTITVYDDVPPVIENTPDDVTVDISDVSIAQLEDDVYATDNCAPVTPVYSESYVNLTCLYNYLIVRTWSATDVAGNSATIVQTITVTDYVPPVIHNVPVDITVEEMHLPIPEPTNVYATDNSGAVLDVAMTETDDREGVNDYEWSIFRTFTVVDDCGNAAAGYQTINVVDRTPPEIWPRPDNVTVECDQVPPPCTPYEHENDTMSYHETTRYYQNHSIEIRVWILTDQAGNTATHEQWITIRDTTPPVLTRLPEDVTVDCDCDNFPDAVDVFWVDNCYEVSDSKAEFSETKIPGSSDDSYRLVRTWTATDDVGNSVTHDQTVTVVDEDAPVLSPLPVDIWAECDDLTAYEDGAVRVRDNCDDSVTVAHQLADITVQGVCAEDKTIVNTWSATDRSGNSVQHSQTVTIQDTTNPYDYQYSYDSCLYPANGLFVRYEHASEYFNVADNCDDAPTVTLTNCTTNQPVDDGNYGGWDPNCFYNSGTDILYVAAKDTSALQSGRLYTVTGTVADKCGNSIVISRKFRVHSTAAQMIQDKQSTSVCLEADLEEGDVETSRPWY
jgi:hypothetical protein